MLNVLKNTGYFFFLFLLYLITGAVLLFLFFKGPIEIFVNQFHTPFLDEFFQIITMFGEGILPVCIIVILFFRKIYYGIVASASLIASTIIVQSLKRTIFSDVLRPKAYLKNVPDLYYIENIEIYSLHSFPSGHSSGAFTLFMVLAYFAKNRIVQIFCFIMAFLVTLSRVYMMQHFFIDTYFGAAIGVFITAFVIYYFENYSNLKNKPFANKPIYKLNS